MSDLVIQEPLASYIRNVAEQERRSPEELLKIMIERYAPPPRPRTSLTDEDIEVPPDIDDPDSYRDAVRAIRPKIYRIARRYWAKVGDQERLRLTDEQLDKQFWVIDHEGIPRLKSEQGTIELPPDPMDALIGLFGDSDITDASVTVRETLAKHYREKHGRPD